MSAQNPNLTVSSLAGTHVDTLLKQHLKGDGVMVSAGKCNNQTGNVTYPQIGTFHRNGFTAFPFDSGLVITTGNVSVAAGPNNSGSASSYVNGYYTDPDLSPYSSSSVMSSAALETDFVAMADWFTLNYIFASEEYCEYVNSTFNDVIVILLTGIDPVTYMASTKNVAVIPGSVTASNPNGIPVGINTVNHGSHGPGSGPGNNPGDATHFVCNAANTQGVQYDGYTTALSAGATVFSCQTYHLKVAVANVGDNSLDSGVFLEEGGLGCSSVQVEQVWSSEKGGDTLVRDGRSVDINFSVEQPFYTTTTFITVETGGDAVLGEDYSLIVDNPAVGISDSLTSSENTFYFYAGGVSFPMHVHILPTAQELYDGQVKTVKLYITTQGCEGFSDLMDDFQKHDTVTLHLRLSGVGIEDADRDDMRLYPNPASHFVQVELGRYADDARQVDLTDVDGRVVRQVPVSGQSVRVDISDLPAGLYFVRTANRNGQVSMPFIKQ